MNKIQSIYKKSFRSVQFFCVCIFLFSCISAHATEFSVIAIERDNVGVGGQLKYTIAINTEGANINALAGRLIYPQDLLELKEIQDGNSIINFWIDEPKASSSGIIFSGIVPGGYQGENGLIFSAVFTAKKKALDTINLVDAKVLSNDGAGTELPVKAFSPYHFMITDKTLGKEFTFSPIVDHDMPESFLPQVGQDQNVFENKNFVAFSTVDKGSGIEGYQVKEVRYPLFDFSTWINATSPYILTDQDLHSYIYVRAVDKAGNERIVRISPPEALPFYANFEFLFILAVVILAIYYNRKKIWEK